MIRSVFSKYSTVTGEFISTIVADIAHTSLQCNTGESWLPGAYDAREEFVDLGDPELPIILRPTFSLAHPASVLPLQVFRVDGIPAGTQVTYPGPSGDPTTEIVNDGYIEWSAVEPGTYPFTFENFPYKEITINAVVTAD